MNKAVMVLIGTLVFSLTMMVGCSVPLTPELIKELAKDNASFCARAGVRGGAGAVAIVPAPVPSGGYGSAEVEFCRSNHDGATVKLSPDGSISIEHK